MRIALIGAPGSGKSDLADKLATQLDIPKIDNYVEQWEKRTGIAPGYLADLVPNIAIGCERLSREYQTMQEKGDSYVICGTTAESLAYTSVRAVENMNYAESPPAERMRINAAVDALTMLLESFGYDHVFYLPLPQNHEDEWDLRLDHNIRDILTVLNIDHTPLTEEDPYALVMETIQPADAAVKVTDEPSSSD